MDRICYLRVICYFKTDNFKDISWHFLGNLQPEKSFGGRIGGDIADIIQGLAQKQSSELEG